MKRHNSTSRFSSRFLIGSLLIAPTLVLGGQAATAHPEYTDEPGTTADEDHGLDHLAAAAEGQDLSDPLEALDAATADVVSSGPFAKVTKNVELVGRGERLLPHGTTDVWALGEYAYIGTFNSPCGTGEGYGEPGLVQGVNGPGIPVFDVRNRHKPVYVGNIPSVAGSRINDVKVATMNGGDILVHSNERCLPTGPGGFEIYNVNDPTNPVHLAHVQTDDINLFLQANFGFVDFGVHNLYLFTRDGRDYAAAQVEGLLGSFQVFDISDPQNVTLASWFGAEYLFRPEVDWRTTTNLALIVEAQNNVLLNGAGASRNQLLHDHFVTSDGTRAYLANWDAGLLLVDLGDLDGSAATLISQAIAPRSEDVEINSHSVWPTADGNIVIEGEEDFDPLDSVVRITDGPSPGPVASAEGAITTPVIDLPGMQVAGDTVYLGQACNVSPPFPPASSTEDQIALIQRGTCTFTEKATNALNAGYDAFIVFNVATPAENPVYGDALVFMGGTPVDIAGHFVGHSTGLLISGVGDFSDLTIGHVGNNVEMVAPDGWSGMRIWDYSDPENPVLASTFNTVCSADPLDASCDPRGTYSSHNVIVEGTKAYISWYSDGVLILDISDPYNVKEVGRYHEAGEAFEERNGGIQDVWGIYKVPEEPWIYASDRNGGLYILKEKGQGSQ